MNRLNKEYFMAGLMMGISIMSVGIIISFLFGETLENRHVVVIGFMGIVYILISGAIVSEDKEKKE